jgi:hypothetical protein
MRISMALHLILILAVGLMPALARPRLSTSARTTQQLPAIRNQSPAQGPFSNPSFSSSKMTQPPHITRTGFHSLDFPDILRNSYHSTKHFTPPPRRRLPLQNISFTSPRDPATARTTRCLSMARGHPKTSAQSGTLVSFLHAQYPRCHTHGRRRPLHLHLSRAARVHQMPSRA